MRGTANVRGAGPRARRATIGRPTRVAMAVGWVLAVSGAGAAASERPGVAVWVGPSVGSSSLATTYTNRYLPPFAYVEHSGEARQDLPLEGGTGPGVSLGLGLDLTRHVGMQLTAALGRTPLSGGPGTTAVDLSWVSFPPPSYQRTESRMQRTDVWPGAEGRLTTFSLAAELALSTAAGTRTRLGLTAGPAWVRTTGRVGNLSYTSYHMGGHSTMFSESFALGADLGPSSGLALQLGGFADVDLTRHVGLRAEMRWLTGPGRDAELRVREVVNADEVVWSEEVETIQGNLAPAPLALDVPGLRATLAVRWRR